MGILVVTEFMTLDGVAQAPGGRDEDRDGEFAYSGWQAPLMDQESVSDAFDQAKTMDALLLGRRTYEIFAGYWPTASEEIPYTRLLNGIPKYVASRTLTEPLTWRGSELLVGDIAESVSAVKERHGETHVIGSLNLVQTLLRLGLVDRLNLWQFPLLLGSGKRVFGRGTAPTALQLTETCVHDNGTLQLTYERDGTPTYGELGDSAANSG